MPLAVLAELTPFDPVAGTVVTIRLSSVDEPSVCSLNGSTWTPGLDVSELKLSLALFDATFSGRAEVGYGAIGFPLEVVPNAARYVWGDQAAKIYVGDVGAAWSAFELLFDGLTAAASAAGGRLNAPLRVNDAWLDAPLLSTYAGSGGLEGGADLKGRPKPLAIGSPRLVEPVLIDATNNVYQFHAYGAANAVEVVFDRLSRFGASVGDHATYAELVAATIPAGQYATSLAQGLIRLGAPAQGLIVANVQGDATGGFVNTPGAIIQRLTLLSGNSSSLLDTASLSAFTAAFPYACSRYLRDQVTLRGVFEELAGGLNSVVGVSWLGKLFVCRAAIGAAAVTLKTDGSSSPIVGEPTLLQNGAPYGRMQLGAARVCRPHALSEIASYTTLNDRGDYSALTTYREGDIVRQPANGRRYRYNSTTPSAGNAPPNATYWAEIEANLIPLVRSTAPPVTAYEGLGWIDDTTGTQYVNAGEGLTYGGTSASYGGTALDIPWVRMRDAAAANFDRRNDRDGSAIVSPNIVGDLSAVDHVQNDDGSVDLSLEYTWAGDESRIDGFEVIVRSSTSSSPYTIGTTPAEEQVIYVPANRRAIILAGVPANRYYTFGVRAYRVVDFDINATGFVRSATVQPTASAEAPYLPSASVAFAGDITGTVGGRAAAVIAATIDASGNIQAGKVVASSLAADTLTKIVSAVGTNVTSTDGGVELLRVQNVPAKPTQGGFVHLILTCTVILATSSANTSSILYARLQRSPAGANTWTELDSWKMSHLQAPTYFDDGLGAYVDGLTWRGSAATQYADVPPSDASYDYRWLVSKTSDGTGSTSASVVAGVVERGRGLAISVRVGAA